MRRKIGKFDFSSHGFHYICALNIYSISYEN